MITYTYTKMIEKKTNSTKNVRRKIKERREEFSKIDTILCILYFNGRFVKSSRVNSLQFT